MFHTRPGNWATLKFVDVIIHIMRFVLPEANVANIYNLPSGIFII